MPEPRVFSQHNVRSTISLDGEWSFFFPKEGTKIDPLDYGNSESILVEVPWVWDACGGYMNYRGQALARRAFFTSRKGAVRIVLKGISHTVTVFVDGQKVGFHHNAYTAYEIDLPELNSGEHELLLHISNEHGDLSALHIPNDYYNYGGINRPVQLQLLETHAYIKQAHFMPELQPDLTWKASVRVCIVNLSRERGGMEVTVGLAGETKSKFIPLEMGESFVEFELDYSSRAIDCWNVGIGNLYFLRVELEADDQVVDDYIDRVGFREVRVVGEQILINGESVFFKGINRHEDHPRFGCALPLEQMRDDLDLIEGVGCNAVRTSHYPNDERFLDLCDERGILVWEENHARGLHDDLLCGGKTDHPMRHPRFREQCRLVNEEMVGQHFNRPSIVVWGILNECDSYSEFGASCYKEQFEQIQSLDTTRPTTYASCFPSKDICQDLPDICSWNTYFGWYGDGAVSESLTEFLESIEPKMIGKPFLMSEFGAAAIPGYRDPVRKAKWSEERQQQCLEECLENFLVHPRFSGVFIWQFCDIRVDESWSMMRPRTMNNKGIFDEFRRPKLVCKSIKRLLGEQKKNTNYGISVQ